MTPRAFEALVVLQRDVTEAEQDRQRQQLQWTAGIVLEHVLMALRAKKIGGGRFEPADFFALPTRAELRGAADAGDTLLAMVAITVALGGTVPPHVQQALQEVH